MSDIFTFEETEFLLVVDSTSKWLDVCHEKCASANLTIEKLRHSFAIMRLPKYIVLDNGPPFGSITFQQCSMSNGIIFTTVSPPIKWVSGENCGYHQEDSKEAVTIKEGIPATFHWQLPIRISKHNKSQFQ
ncbi:hypothetical protein QE152_g37407 [Popillia japonica]|uniref:Integrase catalytic domain-containing protein n=1 Tax=Popillia japonica TaxID=7064 RepID=A0AAW1IAL5_POPJA